jgi:hypothetical protein
LIPLRVKRRRTHSEQMFSGLTLMKDMDSRAPESAHRVMFLSFFNPNGLKARATLPSTWS